MLTKRSAIATAAGVLFLLSSLAVMALGFKTDPYLKSTRTQLMKARACLIAGEDDKAGRRNKAIAYTFTAIAEVEAAMKSNSHHAQTGDVFSRPNLIAATFPRNNMEQALIHLKQARENLGAAAPDQSGHRAKAMEAIDKAVVEVEQATRPGA